ncbi:MAG: heme A synthase [Acidimicrobiales bacterium]
MKRTVEPSTYHQITKFALLALATIVVSGAAVRLTGSGLGCSDWPTCEQDRLVAEFEFHPMVEFVNRLFTGVVSIAVALAVLGSLRRQPYRRDLVNWSWGLVAGVVAQILLGAVTVRLELTPVTVMAHFLVSMVLVWNAVVLVERSDPDPPPRVHPVPSLRRLIQALTVLTAVVLVSGTVVTGAGPHGGDDRADRINVTLQSVARVHSILVLTLIALALVIAWRVRDQDGPLRTRLTWALGAMVAQGAVGYTQYFAGVPAAVVGIHILGSLIVWITVLRLQLLMAPAGAETAPRPLDQQDLESSTYT